MLLEFHLFSGRFLAGALKSILSEAQIALSNCDSLMLHLDSDNNQSIPTPMLSLGHQILRLIALQLAKVNFDGLEGTQT